LKNLAGRTRLRPILLIVAVLATSCQVVHPIKAGQRVSMDPCSLVDIGGIEKVLGGPPTPARVELTMSGQAAVCDYEKKGAEGNGEYFSIHILPETKAKLDKSGENIAGLGREAHIPDNKDLRKYGLYLYVLSNEGVALWIGVSVAGKNEKAMVDAVKPLAKEALSAIKSQFPGRHEFKTTAPPIDVCSLVSDDEVTHASQSVKGVEDAVPKEESESIDGSTGGSWGCWYYPENATIIVHLPKNPAVYEALMRTGAPIAGLGLKSYWKPPVREPSFVSGRLYVVGKNGKAFGVDVDRYDADDQGHKDLSVEVAKAMLARI
jgi:hypothetical protein